MKKLHPFHCALVGVAMSLLTISLAFAENRSMTPEKKPVEHALSFINTTTDQTFQTAHHPSSHVILIEMTHATFETLSSTEQQTVASLWGLTTSDYTHYLQLMENSPEGFYYRDQHLDPSWILGINAKNEEERRKYVTLAILHERERLAKLIVFQQMFDRLQHELFPSDKPIQLPASEKSASTPVTCR
jgi:hypothetical protein